MAHNYDALYRARPFYYVSFCFRGFRGGCVLPPVLGRVSKTYAGVHHHAFISPFPKRLLEEEHIPVAIDPEGFDHAGFIRRINAHIVEFFDTHL